MTGAGLVGIPRTQPQTWQPGRGVVCAELLRRVETRDDAGEVTVSYEPVCSLMARYIPLSARRMNEARQVWQRVSLELQVAPYVPVAPGDRLRLNGAMTVDVVAVTVEAPPVAFVRLFCGEV